MLRLDQTKIIGFNKTYLSACWPENRSLVIAFRNVSMSVIVTAPPTATNERQINSIVPNILWDMKHFISFKFSRNTQSWHYGHLIENHLVVTLIGDTRKRWNRWIWNQLQLQAIKSISVSSWLSIVMVMATDWASVGCEFKSHISLWTFCHLISWIKSIFVIQNRKFSIDWIQF